MTEGDLHVQPGLVIGSGELTWRFGPSSGPGGQHANRANTRAEVSWDVLASVSVDDAQRDRLLDVFGPVVTAAASDERSQKRNRDLARRRLAERLAAALHVEAPRRPSKPTAASRRRRLEGKRRRSELKSGRRPPSPDD